MSRLNIDEIINTPDEFVLNGKTLFVREFTVRERIKFTKLMYDLAMEIKEQFKSNPQEIMDRVNTKDISDFKILDYIFKTCAMDAKGANKIHENNFTEDDFNSMLPSQITAITDVVFKKNNFLSMLSPEKKAAQ